jgi:hypothetical protein
MTLVRADDLLIDATKRSVPPVGEACLHGYAIAESQEWRPGRAMVDHFDGPHLRKATRAH